MSTRRRAAARSAIIAERRTMTGAGRGSGAAPELTATRPPLEGRTHVWLRRIRGSSPSAERASRAGLDQRTVERDRAMLGCAVRGIHPPAY
jgi:hypothetical protein